MNFNWLLHGDEFGLRNEVVQYLTSRKMVKMMIKRCLKNLKSSHDFSPSDPDGMVLISMSRVAEEIALATFESLLHLLYGTKAQDNIALATGDEFSKVNDAANSLLGSKLGMSSDLVEDLKQMSRGIESSIQDLDEDLERPQRHLIRTRASLLNMFTH